MGEGLAKPAQSCCMAGSAWPPVPPVGLAEVVQPVLPPGPRSRSSRPADKDAQERGQPYPDTLFRRRSNNLFRRRSGDVPVAAGTSPERCQNRLLERRRTSGKYTHFRARTGRTTCTTAPGGGGIYYKWHNNRGVLGFSPSHPQQRILAPLWAWGKHNDRGVLGFPPSHPRQRILAPLWAWGKHNDRGVLGFPPSHPQQRIIAPLWAWGKHNDRGVLGFSPSHPHSSNS